MNHYTQQLLVALLSVSCLASIGHAGEITIYNLSTCTEETYSDGFSYSRENDLEIYDPMEIVELLEENQCPYSSYIIEDNDGNEVEIEDEGGEDKGTSAGDAVIYKGGTLGDDGEIAAGTPSN